MGKIERLKSMFYEIMYLTKISNTIYLNYYSINYHSNETIKNSSIKNVLEKYFGRSLYVYCSIPELFECTVCMCIPRARGHRSGTMTDRDGRRGEKG